MLNSVFCMRLNTYGVVIGWLGAIFSFLASILLAVGLGFVDEVAKMVIKEADNPDVSVDQVRMVLVIFFSVYLAFQLINLLSSAMLVVGSVKERHLLLLPWLINNGLLLVFVFTSFIFNVISSAPHILTVLPWVLGSLAMLALWWYMYYGVYSLFKQIQASSEIQRPLIAPANQQPNSYPSYTKI
ncbi:hypothetical protein KR009_009305 [Drosophila setifemur]|nr:hypothetical protein KR009_009305 [Drosophila setifemur]